MEQADAELGPDARPPADMQVELREAVARMAGDELLTSRQIVTLSGISAGDWRTRVRRGHAPPPDEVDGNPTASRRDHRWRVDTWRTWEESRTRRHRA